MKTKAWQEYEQGVDYKTRIGLYSTADLNERFFAGEQWAGIPHEGLPTPVVNFIRYASAWKIAAVTDRRLKMSFFAEGLSDGGDVSIYAKQISNYCDMLWERLKMDYLTKEGLKQAAITGDYVQYFYWDPEIKTGQALTGDINTQLIDNVNYYPGNPNNPDVQSQPYIIIAFRELLSKVKEEAKRNGCENIDEIVSDEDIDYMSGDLGKVELEDSGKCNVLLKMYKKDGRVWCEKSVRSVVIQPEKDTGLTRYPVAMMNWDTRKNCCHGTAEVTGLIPNQVFVNKILALAQLGQVQTSFPKVIYDKTRIREWTNRVAGAIPVNGDIGGAAQYLSPPASSYDAWRGLDTTLQTTMRMMGANDVTLGNIRNPDNTSAFIATRDAAMVPLQSQQERFYSFVEDIGLIWLDFIKSFYKAGRMIPVIDNGQRVFVPIPEGELDKFTMNLRIDVGPSSMWSEIQVLQTLDNLLRGGMISFKQYLERMPDGHIPIKDELLEEVGKQEAGQQGKPTEAGGQAGAGQTGQGADEIAGIAQSLAEAGSIPVEIAQAVMQMAGQGADANAIMQALGNAAQQGQIPMEAVQAIAAAFQGGGQEQAAASQPAAETKPKQKRARRKTGKDAAQIVESVQGLAKKGKIPAEIADAVVQMAGQGADANAIMQALGNAVKQGQIPEEAVKAIAAALQGKDSVQQAEKARQIPEEQADAECGQPDEDAAEIVKTVQTLTQEGSIPEAVMEAVMNMAQQGADADAIMQALGNAAQQGQIPAEVIRAIASELQNSGNGQTENAQRIQKQDGQEDAEGGQPGVNAAEIVKAVQLLAQEGSIPEAVTEAVIKMVQQGADADAIMQALGNAAQQGQIPAEVIRAIASELQNSGNGQAVNVQRTERQETQEDDEGGKHDIDAAEIVKAVQVLTQEGKISEEATEAVMKLASKGADADAILQALKNAADQGQISMDVIQEITAAIQQSKAGRQNGQEAVQDDAAAIVKAVQLLAEEGSIPDAIAQGVIRMAEQRRSAGDILKALKNAAQMGQISADTLKAVEEALMSDGVSKAPTVPMGQPGRD